MARFEIWMRATGMACCLAWVAAHGSAAAGAMPAGTVPAGATPAGTVPARAAPEYNPIRRVPPALGPEADRLLIGFRATSRNAMTATVSARSRAEPRRVTLANTGAADVAGAVARAGIPIVRSRQVTPSMHVLYLPSTLYGAAVESALAKLRTDPAIEFAVPDRRRYPLAVIPDDPLFAANVGSGGPASGQWTLNTPSSTVITLDGNATQDLSATDAVSAWGISTGSPGVVIADVDTGVRFDHPDLLRAGFGGRLLPGYDFVGEDYDPTNGAALGTYLIANDGDGWDPDPSDPGDWLSAADLENPLFAKDTQGPSSWHGTRVAGVMGALSDNDLGIAGMTWGTWILPVRALGKGGGYDSDIIAGIEWAAGLPVTNPNGPPVPPNPFPADIVNLSLGGSTDACTSANGAAYETALQTVSDLGVLVVVSAGNVSGPVELPANCGGVVPGVIAVAGLRNVGTKVGYSSFGAEVGVSAPAGNCVASSGIDCLRSIDTTTNLGATTPGDNSYTNEIDSNLGTSFSAPIVSGIAALMKSVNGNLTPQQLVARLQSAATPFPAGAAGVPTCPATSSSGECACPNGGNQCGTGMVNALAAVEAAQKPIAVIVLPSTIAPGSMLDASASVAGCNTGGSTPTPLTIASFAWTAVPAGIIVSGANSSRVVIDPAPGTLTLAVTDSAGNTQTETVTLTSGSAVTSAPASAGSSKTACPAVIEVSPRPPTVTESFAPTSVSEHSASTLTVTLANANGFALTQSSLKLTLPSGLALAAAPAPATTCTGAAHALTAISGIVSLSGANIAADGNCTITIPLEAAAAGTYTAAVAAQGLETAPAGANTQAASASLTVSAPSGGGGGGGAIDIWDAMLAVGVVLIIRGPAARRFRGPGGPKR